MRKYIGGHKVDQNPTIFNWYGFKSGGPFPTSFIYFETTDDFSLMDYIMFDGNGRIVKINEHTPLSRVIGRVVEMQKSSLSPYTKIRAQVFGVVKNV